MNNELKLFIIVVCSVTFGLAIGASLNSTSPEDRAVKLTPSTVLSFYQSNKLAAGVVITNDTTVNLGNGAELRVNFFYGNHNPSNLTERLRKEIIQ